MEVRLTASDPHSGLIAFNRFGFGARPGDFNKVAADPRGFLKSELSSPNVALISLDDPVNTDLRGTTTAIETSMAAAYERKIERDRAAMETSSAAPPAAPAMMGAGVNPPTASTGQAKPGDPPIEQTLFRTEARARFDKVAAAGAGFVERLVQFWSNHFCVSVAKDTIVRVAAGP